MNRSRQAAIFTPDTEPYLGRTLLHHFDQMIVVTLNQNASVAPRSHDLELSDGQKMARQVIPQAISLTLSIRELIRQGYLFSAHVLKRSLKERTQILFYLHLFPEHIEKWNRGWNHGDAPSLSKMTEEIQMKLERDPVVKGGELTKSMNSLVHGKPDSDRWNLVLLEGGNIGHAASKILNRPDLCDEICADAIPELCIIQGMMTAYFHAQKE